MVSLGELIVELLVNTGELISTFVFEVLVSDPLSAVSLLIGGLFTAVPIVVMGYLVLGALGDAISRRVGSLGRAPPQQG